ncbi:MAG: hypothetical protein R3F11_07400 [Verrucomicrobiales bacterium]
MSIALPAARGGIAGGVVLALARAIGETMAVVMVCGNIAAYPSSIFDPVRPVTSTIALEMGYATASHRALLYAAGLILVLLTGALVGWLAFRQNLPNRKIRTAFQIRCLPDPTLPPAALPPVMPPSGSPGVPPRWAEPPS